MPLWKQILLWIAVLPGALLGGELALLGVRAGMWITSSYYGDDSWLHMILGAVLPDGAFGYSVVFCGAFIAPTRKITVAIVLAALILSLVTLAATGDIRDHRWWDLGAVVAALVGAAVASVTIATGEQDVGQVESR
jgi:hypothetical protein